MRSATEILQAEESVGEALARMMQSGQRAWAVCDRSGVVGVVTRGQLEMEAERTKRVEEMVRRREFPHLHKDHSLDVALDRMGAEGMMPCRW